MIPAGAIPARHAARRDAGFALVVALIVLVAISLAAAHLARAVDTATGVAGNLALHEAALPAADRALASAVALLTDPAALGNREADVAGLGYFASRQPGEDARGVPALLNEIAPGNAGAGAAATDPDDGMGARQLIERMCVGPGPPGAGNCTLVAATEAPGAPAVPLYRITVRVDGPQGSLALVQAVLREGTPPVRLSWRRVSD